MLVQVSVARGERPLLMAILALLSRPLAPYGVLEEAGPAFQVRKMVNIKGGPRNRALVRAYRREDAVAAPSIVRAGRSLLVPNHNPRPRHRLPGVHGEPIRLAQVRCQGAAPCAGTIDRLARRGSLLRRWGASHGHI